MNIDGIGIALIALASAALEIALDRGQIEDWFGSPLICSLLVIAVVGWIATIVWELRLQDPVIDFRLLANRNFGISAVLFLVFGFGLFGSTTLIPQMLQSLYGYRAIDAGLVLGPGALVITLLAPLAARLIQRQIVPPRILLTISLLVSAVAMWHYSTFNLATDYRHYALARALQGLGYGFFFVPVNVIAYSQLRPDQNNRASSLTNLFRNWGGSFGIAFITTAAERRHEFHQANLSCGDRVYHPAVQPADRRAGQLPGPERLHRGGCRARRTGIFLSATATSGEPPGLHGLLSRDRLADSGGGSVDAAGQAF